MNKFVVILVAVMCFGLSAEAQKPVVSAKGDAFVIVRTKDEENNPIYELQRTSPDGTRTMLWRSVPQVRNDNIATPQLGLFALSDLTTIFEDNGEISLLARYDEAGVLVFHFASSALSVSPIFMPSLLYRSSDLVEQLHFKHHGQLTFDPPESSASRLIRFDAQGNIIEDFRAAKNQPGLVTLVSTGGTSEAPPVTDPTPPKANSSSSVQPPTPKKDPSTAPTSTPSEEPTSSTPWRIIVVLIVAATGLLWLLVKNRK